MAMFHFFPCLRSLSAKAARVRRVQRVVVAPLGHAFGVRVQKVQRVVVAPFRRNK